MATLLLIATPALAQSPARVMSLNVCTDQLAMLVAAPGQLVSVSNLATDPDLSFLHDRAENLQKNRGLAEEVFLARPDLVVTGAYSLHNTAELLNRLGMRVEKFDFAQTLETIPGEIRRMGVLLGRSETAETMASDFETDLTSIEASICEPRPTALAYDQNGIALGTGTLGDSVMRAAGFRNLAADLGYAGMAPFPLEQLVVHRPDAILLRAPLADAPALADQIARHPAIQALTTTVSGVFVPRGSWSCGAPAALEAVKALRKLRETIAPCGGPQSQ